LLKWKNKPDRKPLILKGARQVGKTFLMKSFGEQYYKNVVYVNFDNDLAVKELFANDLSPQKIILGLETYFALKINPGDTLLIFDEIQEAPRALTSLKYFNEDAPQYDIICAGSLLGVALHRGTSFPVGKVEWLNLFPMSFEEFLIALNRENLVNLYKQKEYEIIKALKNEYVSLLKSYYFVGGMPEVVDSYVKERDLQKCREIQKSIISAYEQDFSKHAPNEIVPKIRTLYNNVPVQLAKEHKKFVYAHIKEGARAKEFETAMLWLIDCGLIHRVNNVTNARIPLQSYTDVKNFKLFLLDVGLLSCMSGLQPQTILEQNKFFVEFKGALTEQFVLQEMKTFDDIEIFYWTNGSGSAEVDFLISSRNSPIPVEVKAETNLQAKSLFVFRDKFAPDLLLRISMSDYKKDKNLLNLPLYLIENLKSEI
jgi:predicted AAA+ superfamily ATPase